MSNNFGSIPNWNTQGVLPPCDVSDQTSPMRSPYRVNLLDLVLHFAIGSARQQILKGLLDFRKSLHRLGIVQGFQWLDGSYMEHIEQLEDRDPADIDVVTFFCLPEDHTQESLIQGSPDLFDPDKTKQAYSVDSYFVQLDDEAPEYLVDSTAYWYSVWSHRRDGLWKGFLQLDLDPDALAQLTDATNGGAN